jgi:hypothetical protein
MVFTEPRALASDNDYFAAAAFICSAPSFTSQPVAPAILSPVLVSTAFSTER